jgi:hypothetical protein
MQPRLAASCITLRTSAAERGRPFGEEIGGFLLLVLLIWNFLS